MINAIRKYVLFISLFIGTGFISGSIVHFGEGVTTWDITVLCIGIILFTGSSLIQEFIIEKKKYSTTQFLAFLLFSLLLSIAIGMASGGVQHFIDTPAYAAILIPTGLSIGFGLFTLRNKLRLTLLQWVLILCLVPIFAITLWYLLVQVNTLIPDSLRQGHGSHGSVHTNEHHEEAVNTSSTSSIHHDH